MKVLSIRKKTFGFLNVLFFVAAGSGFHTVFSQDPTKSYFSSDKQFLLTYPATWKISNTETNTEFCINAPGANMFKPCMMKVAISKLADGYEKYDIRELSEVELKIMKSQQDPSIVYDITESSFKKINNKEWWILKAKLTKKKEVFLTTTYKTIHNKKVYILTYFATDKKFDENADAAAKMVDTLEFMTKDESASGKK